MEESKVFEMADKKDELTAKLSVVWKVVSKADSTVALMVAAKEDMTAV